MPKAEPALREVSFHNHQRSCRVDLRRFRQIARWLLDEELALAGYGLEVSLLDDAAMTRLNEEFVQHAGSTDVITFDYAGAADDAGCQMPDDGRGGAEGLSLPASDIRHPGSRVCDAEGIKSKIEITIKKTAILHPPCATLTGEILLCPDEALRQARRFRTTWQAELVRYFIHGVLHLLGHDDLAAAARRRMKREENRLLRSAAARFDFGGLARLGSQQTAVGAHSTASPPS